MFKILGFFLLLTSVSAVPFQDCGSAYRLESVDISGCTTTPCKVIIGGSFNVTSKFFTEAAESVLKNVYFVINAIEVPIEEVSSTQCSDESCVIVEGENYLSAEIPVAPNLPPVRADFTWELFNANQKVICFIVPVAIYP